MTVLAPGQVRIADDHDISDHRSMRILVAVVVLAGCSGSKASSDSVVDAPSDDAPIKLDCTSYCSEIQANCTDSDAQYPDLEHCVRTCHSFAVGASQLTDTTGNTLGCRIHHASAAMTMPASHCPAAGPAGDQVTARPPAACSGGDVCASFCTLEIVACGSLDAPLSGNPTDDSDRPLAQYQNMTACVAACANLDKTHPYSTSAVGDTLACRLYHATSAANAVTPNAAMHCSLTAAAPHAPCAGAATP
jgi:hypothetical protein